MDLGRPLPALAKMLMAGAGSLKGMFMSAEDGQPATGLHMAPECHRCPRAWEALPHLNL